MHEDARVSVKPFFANMQGAAMSLLTTFAFVSQAFAVVRPLFPVKAAPPYNGEVVVIGDDLVRRLFDDNPLNTK